MTRKAHNMLSSSFLSVFQLERRADVLRSSVLGPRVATAEVARRLPASLQRAHAAEPHQRSVSFPLASFYYFHLSYDWLLYFFMIFIMIIIARSRCAARHNVRSRANWICSGLAARHEPFTECSCEREGHCVPVAFRLKRTGAHRCKRDADKDGTSGGLFFLLFSFGLWQNSQH